MGNSRGSKRKLDPIRVTMAEKTQQVKHELAMNMILERVKIDVQFAKEVLYIGGETLRDDVKKAAQETISANSNIT